jgi:FkbM family methyltransferase
LRGWEKLIDDLLCVDISHTITFPEFTFCEGPRMPTTTVLPDWGISEVAVPGKFSFKIAYGKDDSVATDPVAENYSKGSIAHLDTLLNVAMSILKPGDRVLDLGSHIGGFALASSALGCEVIAVEASPRNAALVQLSATQNQFDKLQVIQAAIGDTVGTVVFTVHGPWGHVFTKPSLLSRLRHYFRRHDKSLSRRSVVSVPTITVDELIKQHQWENVQFIKMDVEGSEIRAVRGMKELAQRDDAPIVFFESNKHALSMYGENDENLRSEFRKFGYDIYEVKEAGVLRRLKAGEAQTEMVVDYVAAKKLPEKLIELAS